MAVEPTEPSSQELVTDAVNSAGMSPEDAAALEAEKAAVRDFFKQFNDDQKFDANIRRQIRKDRGYASGETQANWAVSTNLIGDNIDVSAATLYAKDPAISVRPAPQVDPPPDPLTGMVPPQPERQRNQDLAKSLELVLTVLWAKGKIKTRMRRVLRSVLSASHGWLKVLPASTNIPDPLAHAQYNTLQENVASVAAQIAALSAGQTLEGQTASVEELQVQHQELQTSMEALANKLEPDTCYGFTFDVVKPENMQVGTDVELLEEYLESDALTEIMYFPVDSLRQKFPDLTDEDLKTVEKYYRKAPWNANRGEGQTVEGEMVSRMYPEEAANDGELYTTTAQQEGARPFARVLEKWSKADNHIYTAVSGVKKWARKPYQPSWASSRFYPYFYFSLCEVDGQRCPQSMSSRGAKLQDEYSSVRSNQRLTRRRSIPGTLVDAGALADTEIEKIQKGVIAEITPLNPTVPGTDFSKLFAAKPVPNIDIRLYDTTPIVEDLARTFGNQVNVAAPGDGTATEAQIQQAGTNVRTDTSRDVIETTLSEVAEYCAEVAWQKIPAHVAQKIAGPAVLWPVGLSIEDITSMVQVTIKAGTTGKPQAMGDREAWSVALPTLQAMVEKIFNYKLNPQTLPLATALEEQVRETLRRFGDETDLARFLPQLPAVAPPKAPPPLAPLPGAEPGMPPGAVAPEPAGAAAPQDPPGAPTLTPPGTPGA